MNSTSLAPRRHASSLFFCIVTMLAACGDDDSLPAVDGGTDAGLDATVVVCESSADCSNALYCDGVETCAPGSAGADARGCVSGSAPCAATETCVEDTDLCRACSIADADGDGVSECDSDCDDADPTRYPGNVEVCDSANRDEDCNPTTIGATDSDRDGVPADRCCNVQDDGTLLCGEDCDDLERDIAPGVSEVCDGLDNDCNGVVDEGATASGFADRDQDGHGDPAAPITACAGTRGFSPYDDDCDDASPLVSPDVPEVCDGRDNDCNGDVDDGARFVVWFRDADGDGFGSVRSGTRISCEPPPGYALIAFDCDDLDAMVNPAATERCNGVDDDCDGAANYVIGPNDHEDDDEDGVPDEACMPAGSDCDDADASTRPGATEICDGRDNDCDRSIDEDATAITWYRDLDGDGWGDDAATMTSCTPLSGHASRGGDCEDSARERNPGAFDACDGTDNDCAGGPDTGFDLVADPTNCGACGRACRPGEECSAGVCGVPMRTCSGDTDCDDLNACTDDRCVSGSCMRTSIAEGASCGGATGTCRGGSCCEGCWDGLRCRAGVETAACGAAGATCAVCADSLACTTEACDPASRSCTTGAVTGCLIAGACWADGAANPADPCSACVAATRTTDWTPRTDGSACMVAGADGQCHTGSCCTGCWDGAACRGGTLASACGRDGGSCAPCNDGLACTIDGCDAATRACTTSVSGGNCVVDGACRASGERNAANTCQSCVPSTSQRAWTDLVADAACTEGPDAGVCKGPAGARLCCAGCWDGAACRTGNTASACGRGGGACASCSDGLACTTERCDASGSCAGDPMSGTCAIAGACWTDGAANPANACQHCDSVTDRTGWTDGGDGEACTSGASPGSCRGAPGARNCCAGCWNSASCLAGDTTAACGTAGATCAVCDDRLSCTADLCTAAGSCSSVLMGGYCMIAGGCYATGARNPSNDCQVCNPASSTSTWSELPATNACTSGGTAGQCRGANGSRACCSGCWDGVTCNLGDTAAACGRTGALCAACTDAFACTTDTCSAATRTCANAVAAGSCLIAGACYAAGAPNPLNGCQTCQPATSTTAFSDAAPGTSCFAGASPGQCRGTPSACCAGCWDGAACNTGDSVFSCGAAGALCQACGCETTDTCTMGACVPTAPAVAGVTTGGRSGSHAQTCAWRADGTLWCWGSNGDGQLGIGSTIAALVPTRVGTATNWVETTTGNYNTCGRRSDGTLWCWGRNQSGALGLGDTAQRTVPTPVGAATTWAVASTGGVPNGGDAQTCGVLGSALYCFGVNFTGQLGDGSTTGRTTPTPIGAFTDWSWVSAANMHVGAASSGGFTCGLRAGGLLYCWGENGAGQLGIGTTVTSLSPARVGTAINWSRLDTGGAHACGIRAGTLWCWGENSNTQLGLTDTTDRLVPTQVETDADWASVSAGGNQTCAIKTDGSLWCWGENSQGQVGVGDTAAHTSPTRVGIDVGWSMVAMSPGNSGFGCAVRTDGTLWCWGSNAFRQLGTGDTMNRTKPTRVCLP